MQARRVQLGDAEAEAHRRVGRGTTALAKDAAAAGEADDVVDGEEEVLVAKLGDQRKLLGDGLGGLFRHAVRPALAGAAFHEPAQMRRWGGVVRHQFAGIFVAQFAEAERAAVGQIHGLRQHLPRIDGRQRFERPQVPLAVRVEPRAEFAHRRLQPNRGQHVAQRLAFRHVHHGAVAGDDGQFQPRRQGEGAGRLVEVVVREEQFERDPEIRQQLLDRSPNRHLVRDFALARDPQRQAVRDEIQIPKEEPVLALGGAAPAQGDELRKLAVGAPAGCQQDQMDGFGVARPGLADDAEFGADDELDAQFPRRQMRLHDPGHRTFVGDGDGFVAQRVGGAHQFVRMGSAAQKAVVGDGVQLRECRRQKRGPARPARTSARGSSHAETMRPIAAAVTAGTASTAPRIARRRRSSRAVPCETPPRVLR